MKFDSYGSELCIFLLYPSNNQISTGEENYVAAVLPMENDLVIIFGLWFSETDPIGEKTQYLCGRAASLLYLGRATGPVLPWHSPF